MRDASAKATLTSIIGTSLHNKGHGAVSKQQTTFPLTLFPKSLFRRSCNRCRLRNPPQAKPASPSAMQQPAAPSSRRTFFDSTPCRNHVNKISFGHLTHSGATDCPLMAERFRISLRRQNFPTKEEVLKVRQHGWIGRSLTAKCTIQQRNTAEGHTISWVWGLLLLLYRAL